jgi:hypothetical protein
MSSRNLAPTSSALQKIVAFVIPGGPTLLMWLG